jgi:hypothetical protein
LGCPKMNKKEKNRPRPPRQGIVSQKLAKNLSPKMGSKND